MRKLNLLPIVLILSLVLLVDYCTFRGLSTLSASLDNPFVSAIINYSYWILSFAVVIVFVGSAYSRFVSGKNSSLFNIAVNTFLTLFVTKVVYSVVFVLGVFLAALVSLLAQSGLQDSRLLVSQIALLVSAIPFVAFLFGVTKGKYNYKVKKTVLYFEDLPDAFDGFTLAQISDIHSGSFDDKDSVEKGVRLIQQQKADLFVFTGDLVNNLATEIVPWIDSFKVIQAPFGKFSVLGNHDYGDYIRWDNLNEKAQNLENLKLHHQEMGFRLLLDEHVKIEKNGQYLTLLGVENWGLGFGERGDLQKALRGVDPHSFKILLSHDPTHWESQVKKDPAKIHLSLSGHTHGMQFGIEALGIKWSPVKYRYKHWAGLKEENGRYLYINRGFGFLGFSGRIGIWPEITVIELRKKK